ncbi:hypothetical protein MTsPCn9_13140 [Croceitalea sp. MTPC9]|uniref:hypothetical protein n=1 Tax=unclassified Croceitalea TaxID=2632280 RepID=UPI002B38C589|nr:hypothetical protein MTsPCn6_15990 [Croceitalea sp. MTPC6]GMN16378.1 hypothetical protein MTsPCn9_13140 [Croceitalea sp. MTPC9]
MNKLQILLLLILIPAIAIGQRKKNQNLAEMTYSTIQKKLDASTSDKRDATVKTLNGIVEMSKKEEFIDKVNNHKKYLESLEYFEIPTANTSIINDSLVTAKGLVFEKSENKYYIEPNKAFKEVIENYKLGIYLYLYINENSKMYLEFVNYTNGKKLLLIEKAKLKFDNKEFEYYLNWVKSRENGFEFCTIETNTKNFIDLFDSISNHQGNMTIEFTGKNGNRTEILPNEMIEEIRNVFDLYSELKVKE